MSSSTAEDGSRRLYKYESFQDGRSIRILTLHPAQIQEEPLCGDLSTEPLDGSSGEASEIDFEAVSYVWGSRKRVQQLNCGDGRLLPVTQSIYDAPQRLRLPERPRRLWADQVCINQEDVEERGQQVNLMNTVYRSARRVLVWLGRDKEGKAKDAVKLVEHLQHVFSDEEKDEEFRKAHSDDLHLQDVARWKPFAKLAMLPWVRCNKTLETGPIC